MHKIKVLEVIRQGEIGGGESHLIDLVEGLDSMIEPIVMSFTSGHMIEVLSEKDIKCHVIETKRPFNLLIQRKIINIIRKEKIDIIHAHGSRAASNMLFASILSGIPLIYTVHGWSFHQDQNFIIKKLRIISEKIICSVCRQTICVSDNNKQAGIKEFGLKNCIVIENGINLKKFNSDRDFHSNKLFKKDENDFIIAFIGRITIQKSPIEFIESIAIAHKKNKNIKGVIIGEGDLSDKVKEFIDANKYNGFIHLEKFRNDIPHVLSSIDVFVLPSLWEGLSISLLEAMAMKKAIVATPTDGTREIITDHKNGIIVPFHQPQRLADSYIEYYDNPNTIISYGEEAYNSIKDRFNSQRVSNQVSDIYKNILR